jgi:polysaccharide deacetylase family protein (PEP-CTERM system associated)
MLHGLSFDVEEIYHAELVRRLSSAHHSSLVQAATEPILSLLARRGLRATFFIVGEVMAQHPDLVRAIAAAGHEIGCHGMSHQPLWELTPDALRQELRQFTALLASILPEAARNVRLAGFRAPTFSLVQRTAWALTVLAEEGFAYDSSIFPVANPVYGVNGGPLTAYRPSPADVRRHDPAGAVVELPMSVWPVAGLRLPVAGGFYLRALPRPLLLHALRQVARERPIVLYLHPWEAYQQTPIMAGLSAVNRFITYYNRASVLPKLARILDEFSFGPLREVLGVQV